MITPIKTPWSKGEYDLKLIRARLQGAIHDREELPPPFPVELLSELPSVKPTKAKHKRSNKCKRRHGAIRPGNYKHRLNDKSRPEIPLTFQRRQLPPISRSSCASYKRISAPNHKTKPISLLETPSTSTMSSARAPPIRQYRQTPIFRTKSSYKSQSQPNGKKPPRIKLFSSKSSKSSTFGHRIKLSQSISIAQSSSYSSELATPSLCASSISTISSNTTTDSSFNSSDVIHRFDYPEIGIAKFAPWDMNNNNQKKLKWKFDGKHGYKSYNRGNTFNNVTNSSIGHIGYRNDRINSREECYGDISSDDSLFDSELISNNILCKAGDVLRAMQKEFDSKMA